MLMNQIRSLIVVIFICLSSIFAKNDTINIWLDIDCDNNIDSITYIYNEDKVLLTINDDRKVYKSFYESGSLLSIHEIPFVEESCFNFKLILQHLSHYYPIRESPGPGLLYLLNDYINKEDNFDEIINQDYIDITSYCSFLEPNNYNFTRYFNDSITSKSKEDIVLSGSQNKKILACYYGKYHLNYKILPPSNKVDSTLNYKYLTSKFEGKINNYMFYSTKHGVFFRHNNTYNWIHITKEVYKLRHSSIIKVEIVGNILNIHVRSLKNDKIISFIVNKKNVKKIKEVITNIEH